jgi:hypothetical protein
MSTEEKLAFVRDHRKDPTWSPHALVLDDELFWLIEPPSSVRQTLYGSEESAIYAAHAIISISSPKEQEKIY